MTVNEFIDALNKMGCSGDEQLEIAAMGGLGKHGKQIKSVSCGFDWDHGAILIHPDKQLILYEVAKAREQRKKPTRKGT